MTTAPARTNTFYVEQLYTGCLAEAAYYIESNGEAAVIDPLREIQPYLDMAKRRGATIKYVLETHFHADFVSGHIDLARATGATIVYGPGAVAQYKIHAAADGEILKLGNITLEVLHTPGHTMESACFLLRDKQGSPYCIFTGDTLFVGDVGRPDLAVAAAGLTREQLAAHLYRSITTKLMPLPDDLIVYPGHGAGSACGKNIGKETFTTLGQQKKLNYALQPMSEQQFVEALVDGLTAPPKYFFVDAGINKKGYAPIDTVMQQNTRPLTVPQMDDAVGRGAVVLDCRTPDAFAKGFVPGSINVGLNGQYAIWVGTLLDHTQPLVVVADEGKEVEAILRLARVGYENVVGYLQGGAAAWTKAGRTLQTVPNLDAAAFAKQYAGHNNVVLDVRNTGEVLNTGKVKGANVLPLGELPAKLDALNKNATYLVHCAGGYRSMIAASWLLRNGVQHVYNVTGGFPTIKESGVPVVPA
jgi:glyoxylase-like metal-dependent hydrolase (beta-lactamase superfamily II)/rhodanese-related sulfurtransferase